MYYLNFPHLHLLALHSPLSNDYCSCIATAYRGATAIYGLIFWFGQCGNCVTLRDNDYSKLLLLVSRKVA